MTPYEQIKKRWLEKVKQNREAAMLSNGEVVRCYGPAFYSPAIRLSAEDAKRIMEAPDGQMVAVSAVGTIFPCQTGLKELMYGETKLTFTCLPEQVEETWRDRPSML